MHADMSANIPSKPAPKVIIFDTDSAVRALIVQGLKSFRNMRIYEVGNAQNIEQRVRSQHFDLIVVGRFDLETLSEEPLSDSERNSKYESFISMLKESCECLVALYEDSVAQKVSQGEPANSVLSKEQWNLLIDRARHMEGLSSSEGYLLYPRPSKPELIPALELLDIRLERLDSFLLEIRIQKLVYKIAS